MHGHCGNLALLLLHGSMVQVANRFSASMPAYSNPNGLDVLLISVSTFRAVREKVLWDMGALIITIAVWCSRS